MEHKASENDHLTDQDTAAGNTRMNKQKRLPRKRKISNYEVFYEAMSAGLKPPLVLYDTFMKEADLMGTYKRHEESYYEEISFLCSKFEEAFAGNDIDQMVDLYDELESLKLLYQRRIN